MGNAEKVVSCSTETGLAGRELLPVCWYTAQIPYSANQQGCPLGSKQCQENWLWHLWEGSVRIYVVSLPARLPGAHVDTIAQTLWARPAGQPLASGKSECAVNESLHRTEPISRQMTASSSVSTLRVHFTSPHTDSVPANCVVPPRGSPNGQTRNTHTAVPGLARVK